MRLVVSLILLIPTIGITYMTEFGSNPYELLLTKTFLPSLLGGFTIFGVADIVNIKLGFLRLSTLEEGLVKGRFV